MSEIIIPIIEDEIEIPTRVGVDGEDAFQLWLRIPGNENKTFQDWLGWLQLPATEAAEEVMAAEVLRVQAEETRVTNESTRVSNETNRNNAELLRNSAEQTRISNEGDRVDAEELRESNEDTRESNEIIRQENEVLRVNAENIRLENEGDATKGRIKAENDRVAAETLRNQHEITRISAEEGRVLAENNREQNYMTSIDSANQAAALANQKATEANNAANSANGAAELANTKAGLANDAAILANEKASLADNAASLATTKAGLANDAAILANEKASLADDKANLANEVASHPQKIESGTWWYWDVDNDVYVDSGIAATPYENYLQFTEDDPPLDESTWSTYSKTQGDYAKEQGDYAKGIGDSYDAVKLDKTAVDIYNVTLAVPLPAGSYYNSTSARAAVPSEIRKRGMELLYETSAGVWYKERYVGVDVANWTTAGNWEVVPIKSQIEDVEEVVATDLNALSERVSALEAAFRNMIISKIQVDSIDVLKDLHYQGRPLFIVSNVAPNIVPDGVPQFWINTATGDFYSAKNNTSAGDWILK